MGKATQMRRHDRAMDDAWIRGFLATVPVGVVATVHDGQPFLNSNLFVYDASRHAIYVHTARTGRTRANMEAEERVCFTAFEMGRLLPADEALEFSVEYAGVVAFGKARVVADGEEAEEGLQLLRGKDLVSLNDLTSDELRRTSVLRIDVVEWSGKRKEAETDFPGAFRYGEGTSGGS